MGSLSASASLSCGSISAEEQKTNQREVMIVCFSGNVATHRWEAEGCDMVYEAGLIRIAYPSLAGLRAVLP